MAAVTCVINPNGARTDLVVASAYFSDDGAEVPPPEVQKLVKYCRVVRLPLILGCDANAHYTVWCSTGINARGRIFFLLLQDPTWRLRTPLGRLSESKS